MARTAGYGGSYDFPNVDFSWLGELPATARETGREFARKDALEGLTSSDPSSLDAAAARLLKANDIEGAAKLYALSTARRSQQTAGASAQAQLDYLKNWPGMVEGLRPKGPAAPAEPPATYAPPTAPPTEAWPSGPPAGGLGPRSEAPGGPVVAQATPPPPQPIMEGDPTPMGGGVRGQINLPPQLPPGAARIGAAPPPQAPTTAVAGPPMAPPEPSGLPEGYQVGRQAPGAGALPPGFDPRTSVLPGAAPVAPPVAPPAQRGPFPVRAPEDTSAADKAYLDAIRLGGPGSRAAPGAAAAARLKFQSELEKTKRYSQDEIKYATDKLHRQMLGRPEVTRQEFDRGNQIFPEIYKEASEVNKGIQDQGMKSQNTLRVMEPLLAIVHNKDFISGPGAGAISKVQGFLITLNEQARLWGVPEELLARKESINTTDTTRLQDAATSLSNQVVLAMLNNKLNTGTSNRDLSAVSAIVGDASNTVEGRKDIIEFLSTSAKQEVALAGKVRAYINKVGRTNMDPDEIRQIAHDFSESQSILKNPDGSLTPLGERLTGTIQLGGGRTPLEAFTTSDVAAALQDASKWVGTPARNFAEDFRELQKNPIDVTGPINRGINAVGGAVNQGVGAVGDFLNARRDTSKYTQSPGGLPPVAAPTQGGPSGGPFPVVPPGMKLQRNNKTGAYRVVPIGE